MKKAGKIIVYVLIITVILVGGLLGYVKFALPDVGKAPDIKVEVTPQMIERGKYLANHVTICMDCHSTRDWALYAGPLKPGQLGSGGESFDQRLGFPGQFIAPNLTPHHLGAWTDGDIYRAMTSGVSKDGHALFPIMPYLHYAQMDKDDIYSLIAYIRSIPVNGKDNKASSADFPVNFIINTIPALPKHQKMPSPADTVAYGGYLVNAANCTDCHTKQVKGEPVKGMDFAGGFEFTLPVASVFSANITPDKATGIGNWSKAQFIAAFKSYADSTYIPRKLEANGYQTVMPWLMYSGMKTSDLEAIYAYLRTLKPINNQVTKFIPRTIAKL